MKRIFYVILAILLIAILLKGCVHKDNGLSGYMIDVTSVRKNPYAVKINQPYSNPYTKTIDGVDYMVSTLPCGKFGGKFVTSTIGEGPKTFNPFTSTDATSSSMADMM